MFKFLLIVLFWVVNFSNVNTYAQSTTSPLAIEEQEVKKINNELINDRKVYKRNPRNKDHKKRMERKLHKRREKILRLMQENPDLLKRIAMSDQESADLPPDFQNLVERRVKEEGAMEVIVEDRNDGAVVHQFLRTRKGRKFKMFLPKNMKSKFLSGTKVRFEAYQLDDHMAYSGSPDQSVQVLSTPDSKVLGEQRLLVVMANFIDGGPQGWQPDVVNNIVFNEVNNFFKEVSYNKIWLTGETKGWITLPMTYEQGKCRLTSDGRVDENYNRTIRNKIINEIIRIIDPQVNFHDFSRILIIYPYEAYVCGYAGISSLGKADLETADGWVKASLAIVLTQAPSTSLIAHELGHSFGVMHANNLECDNVSIGTSPPCYNIEYGDTGDIMGRSGIFHFNAAHKDTLGWFSPSNLALFDTVGTNHYTIKPIEIPTNELQALKILRGQGSHFYIENRKPIGFDMTNRLNGAAIHMASDVVLGSHLLDMTPKSQGSLEDLNDAVLNVGKVFYDPVGQITMETLSDTFQDLQVQVKVDPDTNPPQVAIDTENTKRMDYDLNAVQVQVNFFENRGLKQIELFIDDQLYQTSTNFSPTSDQVSERFYWQTTQYNEGPHRLVAKATDLVGNQAVSAPMIFQLSKANTNHDPIVRVSGNTTASVGQWISLFAIPEDADVNDFPFVSYEISKEGIQPSTNLGDEIFYSLLGDVDASQLLDNRDEEFLAKHLSNPVQFPLTEKQKILADVTQDGFINQADLDLIHKLSTYEIIQDVHVFLAKLNRTGYYKVNFIVSDRKSFVSKLVDLEITNSSGVSTNTPPEFQPIGAQHVQVGSTLTFPLLATDRDNDALFYALETPVPNGALLNGNIFAWTPRPEQALAPTNVYSLVFKVTDQKSSPVSQQITITVNQIPNIPKKSTKTTLALLSNINVTAGDPIDIVAIVGEGQNPTGHVDFYESSVAIPSCVGLRLRAESIACHLHSLNTGDYFITAQYLGDPLNENSTSQVLGIKVEKKQSQTNLTLSPPSGNELGQLITLEATVTGFLPSGTVSFTDQDNFITNCAALILNGQGKVQCQTSTLGVGNHVIRARYNGDSNNTESITSEPINLQINAKPQVAAPSFSVPEGVYNSEQLVYLSTTTMGAEIRYTLDGSLPTSSYSLYHGTAINVATQATIKAVAFKDGMVDSLVAVANYTIQIPPPPIVDPPIVLPPVNRSMPMAFWLLDGNGYDAVGDNHLTLAGTTFVTDTERQQVYSLNGSTDKAISYLTGPSEKLTIATWFKQTASSPQQVILQGGNQYNHDFYYRLQVVLNQARKVHYLSGGVGSGNGQGFAWDENIIYKEGCPVSLNVWHLGVLTHDNATHETILYLDGNQCFKEKSKKDLAPAPGLTVGAFTNPGFNFSGLLDDVRIYNRVLSPEEIIMLYHSTTRPVNKMSTTTTVVSHFNPATIGSSITFLATVGNNTNNVPTGTVTFLDNGQIINACALVPQANGIASCTSTISGLEEMNHIITASYGGDGNNSSSVSAPMTQTVTPNVQENLTAILYGSSEWTLAKDRVGQQQATAIPDNVRDIHIRLNNVPKAIQKITIKSLGDVGVWEWPFNGQNWYIVREPNNGPGQVDLYFDYWKDVNTYTIDLIYDDGSSKSVTTVPGIPDQDIIPPNLQVATPTFNVSEGTYDSPQSVYLNTTTAGAEIRYTLDGSLPTSSSNLYSGAVIQVTTNTTIKAFAFKNGMTDSPIASATYTINMPPINTPPAGLKLWLKFDEGTGTTVSDTSGLLGQPVRHFSFSGSPRWEAGRIGAYSGFFNGTNYLSSSGVNLGTFANSFDNTQTAWVYPIKPGNSCAISYNCDAIFGDQPGTGYWALSYDNKNFVVYNWDGDEDQCRGKTAYNLNAWYHVARVHTGGKIYLYVNGKEECSVATGSTQKITGEFRIGNGYYGRGFKGRIDDARVYDRGLNADEISKIFNSH